MPQVDVGFRSHACGFGKRHKFVCLVGVFATSCSFAPKYERPALPTPEQFSVESASGPSIAQMDWQHFFPDAQLRDLIAQALANNRDIRIASARVAQARAAWRIQGAPLYPQLDASATQTRSRAFYSLPGFGDQYADVKQITAQLSASWEIDFWGRLRNLNDAARNQYLASEEARRAVATDLIAQVANGYLLEREYEERLQLAERSVATRQESFRIMRRRFEVGSGSRLDMDQAQILLSQAQIIVQGLVQDQGANRNALALLVGAPVNITPGELDLTQQGKNFVLPAGLPSELLVNRPDIVAAEYQLRAANANIGVARAAFFPNIQLTGAYGASSSALSNLFNGGTETWNFTPVINLPLFNAGRLKGNLQVAKAQRDEAVAQYERSIQSAFRDVSDALLRHQQLGQQVASTRTLLDAQRERARLAQLRFDNGRSAYLEVLDAQRDLFDAEQTLVQLRRAELGSIVALYAALGGGFDANQNFEGQTP
jgi:NodT family efflux transporter outer membrane factor (OMF) lipoprotein